jgi:outer membrane protein assembly factor BamB
MARAFPVPVPSRIAVLASLVLFPSFGVAADWPQFRGPGANGLTSAANLPEEWDTDTNVKWKVPIPGSGWSAPIVAGGKVFVTTVVPIDTESRDSECRFEVHCLDLVSGKTLWQQVAIQAKPRIPKHEDNTYASETPVTDGERVVAYFGMTGVFCYDFDGNLLWKKDLGAYPMDGDWGTSSSPAMHDGLVFIQVDNEEKSFLAALDAKSGDEQWRLARDEKSNWGSPTIWKNGQRTELVTSGNVVRSYDPKNGKQFWELTVGGGRSCSSPAPYGDLLLVGREDRSDRGQGAGGLFAVKAGATGDITPAEGETRSEGVLWSNRRAAPAMASPILLDGFVYILSRRGSIVGCYDAATGEEVYRERLPGSREFWASPWAADGKIFCPGDTGATHVLGAGPEFQLIRTNQLDGRFWATSALTENAVLLRSTDTLYCLAEID